MEITRPDKGDPMMLSEAELAELRVGEGGTTIPVVWVLPLRGRDGEEVGRPSISTRKVSPSTVTGTGDWASSPTWTWYQLSPTLIRKVVTANPDSPGFGKEVAHGARKCATD